MAEKRGRFIKYNKQQVLEDVVSGKMSASEIAKKHHITRDMVYSLKHAAKKKNIIRDPVIKLDDLDPIEPREKREKPMAKSIYMMAQDYADGSMSGTSFYRELCSLLNEPITNPSV